MNKADRAAVLHQVTQFGALSETEFEALNAHSTLIELTGGTTLLQEGAEGNDAYVLVTGALEVTQQSPTGNHVVLARLEPVRLFGEQSTLARNQNRRTASVTTLEPSTLLRLPGEIFASVMHKNLELHSEIDRIGNFQAEANRFLASPIVAAISHQDIFAQCERLELTANTSIFKQGDEGNDVFLVISGQVNIIRQVGQTHKKIGHIQSGYSFGEIAGDGDGMRSATAETETDCTLLRIPRALFTTLLKADPALAEFIGVLSSIYALAGGVMSTQNVTQVDGRSIFNSTFHLPTGQLAIGSLDPEHQSYLVQFADEQQTLETLTYGNGPLSIQLGLNEANMIRSIDVQGAWNDLPKAQQFLIDQSSLSPWRQELFLGRGQLYLDVNERACAMGDIVCNCLQLSLQDIIDAPPPDQGLPAGAGGVCGGCAGKVNALMGEDIWSLAEVRVEDDSHPMYRTIHLKPVFKKTASHLPGQHISVQCLIGNAFVERSYTLTSPSGSEAYEIIVKKEAMGQMSQRFFASNLHEQVIRVSEPQGQFFWDQQTQLKVLNIVAGIGVTPALGMAQAIANSSPLTQKVSIHLSISRDEQLTFVERLKALSAAHETLSFDTRITGQAGHLDQTSLSTLLAGDNWDAIFLCGPTPFLDATKAHLLSLGVSESLINIEIFHQAGGEPRTSASTAEASCQKPSASDFKILSAESNATLIEEAESFLKQVYTELDMAKLFDARWLEVRSSIAEKGYYDHTQEELAYGAQLCWRNSARCVGRQFWRGLDVRDYRHLTQPQAMADTLVEHIKIATNGGNLRPTMTVFAPDRPEARGPRIWNNQLIRYAGYDVDGQILGDSANSELTRIALEHGWQRPCDASAFDILPLVIDAPGHPLYLHAIPESVCLEVPITHPEYLWFETLSLKWYALPAVSDVEMRLGGVLYGALPFNGWYMETEIGARNFTDSDRYDLTHAIAVKMGLDTSRERTLWKDRAQLELNRAVLYSFDINNVTIMDHHEASDSFMRFVTEETHAERDVWAKWSWVVPPTGGSLTKVFHHEWEDKTLLPNFFYREKPWLS